MIFDWQKKNLKGGRNLIFWNSLLEWFFFSACTSTTHINHTASDHLENHGIKCWVFSRFQLSSTQLVGFKAVIHHVCAFGLAFCRAFKAKDLIWGLLASFSKTTGQWVQLQTNYGDEQWEEWLYNLWRTIRFSYPNDSWHHIFRSTLTEYNRVQSYQKERKTTSNVVETCNIFNYSHFHFIRRPDLAGLSSLVQSIRIQSVVDSRPTFRPSRSRSNHRDQHAKPTPWEKGTFDRKDRNNILDFHCVCATLESVRWSWNILII